MKILYSAIGTTDPIRGCYDGAMLHIIRHYKPDMAVLFLSKEMVDEEERNQQYTKAISYVNPQCEVRLIKTELQEVHKIDTLYSLVDEFYRLKEEFSEAEFLINLTSGTPQMCQLMTYLAIENADTIGVQVDTPTERSNRSEHALQGNEDIDFVIECNVDNEEGSPSRCHEPVLKTIKRRFLKERFMSMVKSYEYKEAFKVFKEYKILADASEENILEDIANLLQHCIYRSSFEYENSLKYLKKELRRELTFDKLDKNKKIRNLIEYLYIAQIRVEKGLDQDFLVKLTPYLHEFMKYILSKKYGVDFVSIRKENGENKKSSIKIDIIKLKKKYPDIYESWERCIREKNYTKKDFELSFPNMFYMIKYHCETKADLIENLEIFGKIHTDLRNRIAHEISVITLDDIKEVSQGMNCQDMLIKIRGLMERYADVPKVQLKLIYHTINDILIRYSEKLK